MSAIYYYKKCFKRLLTWLIIKPNQREVFDLIGSINLQTLFKTEATWELHKQIFQMGVLLTRVEGERVDEGARNLLCRSLVPQGKVIGVEHPLFVFSCQEVSWNRKETEVMTQKMCIQNITYAK